jgi:hypothetical protein
MSLLAPADGDTKDLKAVPVAVPVNDKHACAWEAVEAEYFVMAERLVQVDLPGEPLDGSDCAGEVVEFPVCVAGSSGELLISELVVIVTVWTELRVMIVIIPVPSPVPVLACM